jgi:hypothetical protein
MATNLGVIKFLLWVGIVLFLIWFILLCFAPAQTLEALGFPEIQGYFLRVYGIFPLGWAILYLFALKDVEKNIAILNSGVITGILTAISLVAYHFVTPTTGWFHLASAVVLVVFSLLIYIFKPRAAK